MIVIKELKHNKVVEVHMPKNSDFFARFGYSQPSQSQYSGDDDIPQYSDKIQTYHDLHNQYKDFVPPPQNPED